MSGSLLAFERDDTVSPAGLIAIAAANIVALGIFAAVQLQPRPGEPVAAWFPGGDGAAITAVAQAGGGLLSSGPAPGVVQAISERPDFFRRLREAGAVLIVSSPAGAGCAPIISDRS